MDFQSIHHKDQILKYIIQSTMIGDDIFFSVSDCLHVSVTIIKE